MKYGETLRQRSIPEWGHYNVDYDEIKRLIKEFTTPGTGKAVSIPGQGNTAESDFESLLYLQLVDEFSRVNLFVKSKYGEIDRKLDHFGRQVARLELYERSARAQKGSQVRRLERFAKAEDDILKIGEDIKRLSQFINAQKLAWKKLLKKYKKWTGSDTLGAKYTSRVLDQPDSFWCLEIDPLMNRYTNLLHTIRAGYQSVISMGKTFSGLTKDGANGLLRRDSSMTGSEPPIQVLSSVAGKTNLDFDDAVSLAQLGPKGGRAVYWVHPDSLIELQVLLLQHLRLFATKIRSGSSSQSRTSPAHTPLRRQSSATLEGAPRLGKQDEYGCLIMDDVGRFASELVNMTVGDSEDREGTAPSRSVAHSRWTSENNASVIIRNHWERRSPKIARLKRKNLASFLDVSKPYSGKSVPESNDNGSASAAENLEAVREWLASHPQVRCLASICGGRTRFVGLSNNESAGLWATLDTDISVKRPNVSDVSKPTWADACRKDARSFPHAVLEVRCEGGAGAELIKALDESHLTERVRGFSLETHAVWVCCRPQNMVPPLWLPALNKDIRKIPDADKQNIKGLSEESLPMRREETSGSATSVVDFQADANASTVPPQSSNTSMMGSTEALGSIGRKKKRRVRPRKQQRFRDLENDAPTVRYWSEYDHPEDGDGEDAYVIYVDPNAPVTFPGQETLQKFLAKVKSIFGKGEPTAAAAIDPEDERLLPQPGINSDDDSESESTSSSDEDPEAPNKRSYGTIKSRTADPSVPDAYLQDILSGKPSHSHHHHHQPPRFHSPGTPATTAAHRARERTVLRLYAISLLASVAVLALVLALTATARRRRRLRAEVDAAVLFGALAGLCFALAGVVGMLSRRDRLGWWHRGVVFGVFVGVCVCDGVVAGWVFA